MKYVEMTIEEAMQYCNKKQKVLVAVQDLEKNNDDVDLIFVKKEKGEYSSIFEDVKTAISIHDDFVKQFNLFTEKQNIPNINPRGFRRIVLID